MPFLLCNILFAFSLFFDLSSLTFYITPRFLCLKNPLYAYIYAGCVCWIFSLFPSMGSFPKNDVLFSPKRRVVFIKTTCCFHQNDVFFSSKRRVVFCARSDVKKPQRETQSISQDFELYKYLYSPLSRARVHVHYRSFYLFAVTSVTL